MARLTPFVLGLDLGQLHDYSALTVIKEHVVWEPREGRLPTRRTEYHLQHLERFPLSTPYRKIARRVCVVQQALKQQGGTNRVAVDTTGVGLPVFEMLQEEGVRDLCGITITGDAPSREGQLHRVPKRDLVSTLQVLLQNGRLKFAADLPLADVLKAELQNFRVKINIATGHDSYEAWRERDHDDLVLSLACACYLAENETVSPFMRRARERLAQKPTYGAGARYSDL